MKDNIRSVKRSGKGAFVFNDKGRLVRLTPAEFRVFEEHGSGKTFPQGIFPREKRILEGLCALELVSFADYTPKREKKSYGTALYKADSGKPIYDAPLLAHLAITTRCNMRCVYCSVRQAHQRSGELSTRQWKAIIKKLSDAGVYQIGFTGGEPTLRKDILDLMRFTESVGCVCNLTTNGWMLTERFVEGMARTGIKQCQVSLDSFDAAIHDRLRGKGSKDRAIAAITLLHRQGIHVGIDCVVSTNNIKSIPQMVRECETRKIEYVTLIKLKKGDLDQETFQKLVPAYESYGRLIERMCARKNELPNVTIDCASVANLQYTLRDDELTTIPTAGCPVGHNLICVAPNGDLYPCAALLDESLRLGNILTDDLNLLWKGSPLLKTMREVKKRVQGPCSTCSRLDFCRGGCRGNALAITTSLWASDPSCARR